VPTPLTNNRWGYESSCFVCEQSNDGGLQIPFWLDDNGHDVFADFTFQPEHSGAPSLVHGGLSLAVLDEAQAWAVIAVAGKWGLTKTTQASFDGAVFIDHPNRVVAWVVEETDKTVRTEAEILDQNGAVAVRSETTFVVVGVIDESQVALGLDAKHHGLLDRDS